MTKLLFNVPFLPPTTNHAYFNLPNGGRTLSPKARKYKEDVKNYLTTHYQEILLNYFPETDIVFKITSIIFFDSLKTKTKDAKNIYKIVDVSNRIKLFEDAVFETLGINDSRVFSITLKKGVGKEGTIILVEQCTYEQTQEDIEEYAKMDEHSRE